MSIEKEHIKNIEGNKKTISGLGGWNIYFILKFVLAFKEYIDINTLQNLGFAAFLLLPIRQKFIQITRLLIALPLALALLYSESFLPPFNRLLTEATLIRSFNLTYLFELAGRFINIDLVALLFIFLALYIFVQKYIRVTVLVVTSLVIMNIPIQNWIDLKSTNNISSEVTATKTTPKQEIPNDVSDLNSYLDQFYEEQKNRSIVFRPLRESDIPFDIIFIHICSISWDDLRYSKLENELPTFDIMLDNFNTAASYSGPAALRLLRASCGQLSHSQLYSPPDPGCLLFENLEKIGFEGEIVMNHDGHFDDFIGILQKDGPDVEPLSLENVTAPLQAFDSSPVYKDLSVLQKWLETRENDSATHKAVYYNTVTMHDGNRYLDSRSRINSIDNFDIRLKDLLQDLQSFFSILEESERRVIVVMSPEHGAAIRGDRMQISGLREIPSPKITLGPAGIKIIGPGFNRTHNPIRINTPTSYIDLIQIVSEIIGSNPFEGSGLNIQKFTDNIIGTELVSENAGTVIIRHNNQYYMRQPGSSKWIEYKNE